MKRYKLKKDTPAFKAGTECYIEEAGNMVPCRGISYTIVHKDQLEKNPNILTDWFEEMKPAEPLIKDKKIRKAVRAWAEANDITEINVADNGYELWGGDDDWCIHFSGDGFVNPFEHIKPQQYTIEELCGEDEE